ncbi:hypothetical protein GQ44DRAFT_700555 [Phaeosphaeriaceae sp. PMI808]|nr:hypothetical protein GQ44DRAFT_700555 [Phaeosphaeriaceae sp. PMI808]
MAESIDQKMDPFLAKFSELKAQVEGIESAQQAHQSDSTASPTIPTQDIGVLRNEFTALFSDLTDKLQTNINSKYQELSTNLPSPSPSLSPSSIEDLDALRAQLQTLSQRFDVIETSQSPTTAKRIRTLGKHIKDLQWSVDDHQMRINQHDVRIRNVDQNTARKIAELGSHDSLFEILGMNQ